MTQDEDVMRVWAKSMAERGWFVNVQASRINEHFAIKEVPRAGWALDRELAMARLASEASPAKINKGLQLVDSSEVVYVVPSRR
jgi:hypothetical protein